MTEIKEIEGFTKDTVCKINNRPVGEFLQQELRNTIAEYLNALQEFDVTDDDKDAKTIERMERTIQTMAMTSIAIGVGNIEEKLGELSTYFWDRDID